MANQSPYSRRIDGVQLDEQEGAKADKESKGRRVESEQIVSLIGLTPGIIRNRLKFERSEQFENINCWDGWVESCERA